MKLTAQRKGDAITSHMVKRSTTAVWWRERMRSRALDWRQWKDTQCIEYASDALALAISARNLALKNERQQGL